MQISGTGDVVLTDVKEISAGMVFDEKLSGRLSIRNNADHLIAEITKTAVRPLELGLEPGQYYVTLQQGSDVLRAEFTLAEGQRALVTRENFAVITADPARRRGDDAEPSTKLSQSNSVYTFFVNFVDESFHFPLVGFVNIARGNHQIAQAGFINWNTKNFTGLQASFVNSTWGNFTGLQAGFVNTIAGDAKGLQSSFVNIAIGELIGVQAGFVNTSIEGLTGPQFGFVNTAVRKMTGAQLGFVNVAAQGIRGVQIGFVNYADSIEDGVPIGFLSIVRRGGYYAVEYSFSEFFPATAGVKLGVEKFYTTIFASYNFAEGFSRENFVSGIGFGSIIPIGKGFFFNPELNCLYNPFYVNEAYASNGNLYSLVPSFGFKPAKHFSVTVGPSVSWVFNWPSSDSALLKPLFSIYSYDINEKNSIVIGVRAAARFQF